MEIDNLFDTPHRTVCMQQLRGDGFKVNAVNVINASLHLAFEYSLSKIKFELKIGKDNV